MNACKDESKDESESIQPVFWDVKAILDWVANGSSLSAMQLRHGESFSWSTREELLAAKVQLDPAVCNLGVDCFLLIDPELIGVGLGSETNLVKALRDDGGVGGNGRMAPEGNADGQFATPLQIDTIVRWIDAGCP